MATKKTDPQVTGAGVTAAHFLEVASYDDKIKTLELGKELVKAGTQYVNLTGQPMTKQAEKSLEILKEQKKQKQQKIAKE